MPLCGGKKVVQRKLVLLGDGACGKTSLLNVFTRGFFPVREPLSSDVARVTRTLPFLFLSLYVWSSRHPC